MSSGTAASVLSWSVKVEERRVVSIQSMCKTNLLHNCDILLDHNQDISIAFRLFSSSLPPHRSDGYRMSQFFLAVKSTIKNCVIIQTLICQETADTWPDQPLPVDFIINFQRRKLMENASWMEKVVVEISPEWKKKTFVAAKSLACIGYTAYHPPTNKQKSQNQHVNEQNCSCCN